MAIQAQTIAVLATQSWLTKLVYHSTHSSSTCAIGWIASLALTIVGWSCDTLAQPSIIPLTPEICDISLTSINAADANTDPNIVTADTVSPKGMTVPSLWWTSEQFPAKLVTNWIANRSQNQIYVLVDTQYWNMFDYIDRYRTIDRFGRVAHDYGYNLKICNTQKIAVAEYTCDNPRNPNTTSNPSRLTNQNSCQIWLNTTGQTGLGMSTK
jgi:hypothetical protein